MALVLPALENQVSDKRVESILFPRLDEGSSPSWSTKEALIISVIQICSDKKSDKLKVLRPWLCSVEQCHGRFLYVAVPFFQSAFCA